MRSDFCNYQSPSIPFAIAPNGSYSITVQFNTPLLGTRSGIINITSGDYDEPPISPFRERVLRQKLTPEGNSVAITDSSTGTNVNNTDFGTIIYNFDAYEKIWD